MLNKPNPIVQVNNQIVQSISDFIYDNELDYCSIPIILKKVKDNFRLSNKLALKIIQSILVN